jgi:hypothetical protein
MRADPFALEEGVLNELGFVAEPQFRNDGA